MGINDRKCIEKRLHVCMSFLKSFLNFSVLNESHQGEGEEQGNMLLWLNQDCAADAPKSFLYGC